MSTSMFWFTNEVDAHRFAKKHDGVATSAKVIKQNNYWLVEVTSWSLD